MPSRIDIGPEGGPFVAINENSNNLELQDINGNVIAKWDETAGQWDLNNNSLTGINAIDASSANVGSVSTEEAIIDGNPVKRLDTYIQDGTTSDEITVDFGGDVVNIDELYFIKFDEIEKEDTGEVLITFAGDDGAGNENYDYFDESGAKNTNQDAIEIVSTDTVFTNMQNHIRVYFSPRPSVRNQLVGITSRWDGFAQVGGYDASPSEDSIQITFTGGLSDGSEIQLWRAL